jgi:hypothetical protein
MANNYDAFIAKHPELADKLIREHGDLQWLKKYTDEDDGKVKEYWELKNGVFTDMTAKKKAYEELEAAQEALCKINGGI